MSEGEEMAKNWLAGKTNMHDDLGTLVASMVDGQLGAVERDFLRVVGEAARSAAKRKGPAPSRASPPAAQPTAAPPQIDADASWRRALERQRAARFEELARRNSRIPVDGGGDFWRARNEDWNGV
jgi:hypothetical protein